MSDWEDLVESASLRKVWNGRMTVSEEPLIILWWMAWNAVANGQDILHVGVTGEFEVEDTAEEVDEVIKLANRVLGGIVDMAWRSVGRTLGFEVMPLQERVGTKRGERAVIGKVIVRAYDGKDFDPLMVAIQETKKHAEKT